MVTTFDELLELLETQLGEVGIDLKTEAKSETADDEDEPDEPDDDFDDEDEDERRRRRRRRREGRRAGVSWAAKARVHSADPSDSGFAFFAGAGSRRSRSMYAAHSRRATGAIFVHISCAHGA